MRAFVCVDAPNVWYVVCDVRFGMCNACAWFFLVFDMSTVYDVLDVFDVCDAFDVFDVFDVLGVFDVFDGRWAGGNW